MARLKVDHIDLYQLHHVDRTAPIEEIWQAADRLIAQGKITYLGSSNFPGWKIAQASEKALARQRLGLVSEQSIYNLLERSIELEVIPSARAYGLGVIAWSPLAGGLLAGEGGDPGSRRQSDRLRRARTERSEQLARYAGLCGDLGESPSAVALAWTLHQEGIVSTIVGSASREQLASVSHVPDLRLSAETLAALDAIFPRRGPAPEAYAW